MDRVQAELVSSLQFDAETRVGGVGVIDEIVPSVVSAAEAFDDGGPAPLFPEEEALIIRAVDTRRREFATVRACARRALARLGVPPGPLVYGEGRAPRWPDGVVGSLTHCKGYRAAAVALTTDLRSIGIDAEPALPLPYGVLDRICRPDERDGLADLFGTAPEVCWDRLLFCAKEAIYKASFPLSGQWFGFLDARVEIHQDHTFTGQPLVHLPGSPDRFTGRWATRDGLLLTTVAVTHHLD